MGEKEKKRVRADQKRETVELRRKESQRMILLLSKGLSKNLFEIEGWFSPQTQTAGPLGIPVGALRVYCAGIE